MNCGVREAVVEKHFSMARNASSLTLDKIIVPPVPNPTPIQNAIMIQ